MALIKTSNPALGQNTFSDFAQQPVRRQPGGRLGAYDLERHGEQDRHSAAVRAWPRRRGRGTFMQTHDRHRVAPELLIGAFGGLIFALVTIFKKTWSPVTAPIYALLEGLALGGLSAMFEIRYPGIALEAVGLTFGTLFVMLFALPVGT